MKQVFTIIASVFIIFSGYFAAPAPLAMAQGTFQDSAVGGVAGAGGIESQISGCNPITNFSLCVLWFIYHVILNVSFWLVGLAGKLFDFFISYSLNSEAYTSDFIAKGWGVIRDIANVAFIFTLLYLAIRHILGFGGVKKPIATLIIVAILLNFSLFFTKVVIDAGNILARAFYNSIVIQNDSYQDQIGFKSLSVGLLDHINPQRLFTENVFQPKFSTSTGDFSTNSGTIQNPAAGSSAAIARSLDEHWGYYAFIFLLLASINIVLAFTFLSVALLFLGRIVGLWFAMIFSPVAFITLAIPNSGGMIKKISFDSWKDTTLKLAFVAPIFIFFLYLTIMFLTIFFATPIQIGERDTFMTIMEIGIPFIFVVFILQTAKKVANDMAGEAGSTMKVMANKLMGFAAGAAMGVGGFALRNTAGRLAGRALKNGNYEQMIANSKGVNRWMLMKERNMMKKMNESSYDLRNAPKAKGLAGQFSKGVAGALGAGMSEFTGKDIKVGKGSDMNRKKYEEEQEKKKLKMAEELEKIGRNEDTAILDRLSRKGMGRDGKNKDKIIDHLDDTINTLRVHLVNADKDGKLSLEEKAIRNKEIKGFESMQSLLRRAQTDSQIKMIVEDGKNPFKEIRDKDGKVKGHEDIEEFKGGLKDYHKKESKRRRNEYADSVEGDPIYWMKTGESTYTADRIRKGDKVESAKDKMAKAAKQMAEEEDKDKGKDEEEKPTPPPSTPPPTSPPPGP